MKDVFFEEELVDGEIAKVPYRYTEEIVFTGTYILDSLSLTPEQQREKIFNMMKIAGISVENPEELVIGYEGADDNNGYSETQSTKFVVNRVKKEKLVEKREEIFTGTYILDSLSLTPEQQREKIFNMMEIAGISVENPEELVIGYEGADDNNGYSETQSTKFVVSRITYEKASDEEITDEKINEDEIVDTKTPEEVPTDVYEETVDESNDDMVISDSVEIKDDNGTEVNMDFSGFDFDAVREYHGRLVKLRQQIKEATSEEEKERLEAELLLNNLMYESLYELYLRFKSEENKQSFADERDRINNEINEISERCFELDGEYFKAFEAIKEIKQEEAQKLDSDKLLSEEEIKRIKSESLAKVVEKYNYAITIRNEREMLARKLSALKEERSRLLAEADVSNILGVSGDSYSEIMSSLSNKETLRSILSQKGLGDILAIPAVERTDEQKKTIEDALNEIYAEVINARKNDEITPITDLINILYNLDTKAYIEEMPRKDTMSSDEIDAVRRKVISSPQKIVPNREDVLQNQDITPRPAPKDMTMFDPKREETLDSITSEADIPKDDEIKSFKGVQTDENLNNQETLSDTGENSLPNTPDDLADLKEKMNSVIARYGDDPELVSLLRNIFERLENARDNVSNNNNNNNNNDNNVANEDHTPEDKNEDNGEKLKTEITIFRDINSGKQYARNNVFERFSLDPVSLDEVSINGANCYEIKSEDVQYLEENKNNDYSPYIIKYEDVKLEDKKENDDDKLKDKITVYRDLDDNGKMYARGYVFTRFGFNRPDNSVEINGAECYELKDDDVKYLEENKNNDYSPYTIDYVDVHLSKGKDEVETIVLFRAVDDGNQIYASKDILDRFGLTPNGDSTTINGFECYKISADEDSKINEIANKSENPKMVVKYVDVKIKKQDVEEQPIREPHVEEILDKLTGNLDIKAKDGKRYTASNIKVAKSFIDELHSGSVLYNIVHFVPAIVKFGVNLFRKATAKIALSKRGKKAMEEIDKRLHGTSEDKEHNLTDADLEVLFKKYKGSQLKTDMNNQINPLILNKLREFGLEKVAKLNNTIKQNYASLFGLIGQIKVLEEKLKIANSPEERQALQTQMHELYVNAAGNVKIILDARTEADNILSSGIHGIEEDFKAVSTKLNYVGMRFAKKKAFNNELQHELGTYGKNLNAAITDDNPEAIVSNFMGLESCYFENTEIKKSIYGHRSTGDKYYSPLAEQFDYRDDPFVKDIFTTVAVTSAAISAINAIRVHQIESQQLLKDQQSEATRVNHANDATINQVQQTASQISGKRSTFQQGMEAQAHQNVLNTANTQERIDLDMTQWTFNGTYHTADAASHQMWNQMHSNVSQQLTSVGTQYAQHAITQAQAIDQMAQIANNTQSTFNQIVSSGINMCVKYAQSHPQHDLTGVIESMKYIQANPSAIIDMNQGMVDVTNLADTLSTVQATHMNALSALPSDMLTTIISGASATVLAARVLADMKSKVSGTRYGNEVTDMMNDYINGSAPEEETKGRTR